MPSPRCACGCGGRAVQQHHAVKAQTIRREGGDPGDARWLVGMAVRCHLDHEHGNGRRKLPVWRLPDAVFEVARETFGAGRAFNELRRAYAGDDPRLDGLLS